MRRRNDEESSFNCDADRRTYTAYSRRPDSPTPSRSARPTASKPLDGRRSATARSVMLGPQVEVPAPGSVNPDTTTRSGCGRVPVKLCSELRPRPCRREHVSTLLDEDLALCVLRIVLSPPERLLISGEHRDAVTDQRQAFEHFLSASCAPRSSGSPIAPWPRCAAAPSPSTSSRCCCSCSPPSPGRRSRPADIGPRAGAAAPDRTCQFVRVPCAGSAVRPRFFTRHRGSRTWHEAPAARRPPWWAQFRGRGSDTWSEARPADLTAGTSIRNASHDAGGRESTPCRLPRLSRLGHLAGPVPR
jgi:hypothetical protein